VWKKHPGWKAVRENIRGQGLGTGRNPDPPPWGGKKKKKANKTMGGGGDKDWWGGGLPGL